MPVSLASQWTVNRRFFDLSPDEQSRTVALFSAAGEIPMRDVPGGYAYVWPDGSALVHDDAGWLAVDSLR